jgi:hypothetical protein
MQKNVLLVMAVCTVVVPWKALPEVWKQLPLSARCRRRAPWEAMLENPRAPTINA